MDLLPWKCAFGLFSAGSALETSYLHAENNEGSLSEIQSLQQCVRPRSRPVAGF